MNRCLAAAAFTLIVFAQVVQADSITLNGQTRKDVFIRETGSLLSRPFA